MGKAVLRRAGSQKETHRGSMLSSLGPQEASQDVYITRQETSMCVPDARPVWSAQGQRV